jgi:Pentapeptide repeats (8 copies)
MTYDMTLPITPQTFWIATVLAVVLVLSALIYWLLQAMGQQRQPPLWEELPERGQAVTVILGLVWLGLFLLTIVAAYLGVLEAIHPKDVGSQPNLGLGALLAALLGAPFVIWGTWLKYQTVRYQKEGHITDRINKAVEQLGSEKALQRIGRPVTIWAGKPTQIDYSAERAKEFEQLPRTRLGEREWSATWNHETDDVEEGYMQTVSTWPEDRTVIQWQGEALNLKQNEVVGGEGNWQVFSETVPNIEVRIGAILSLERIAQDSTIHDKGRDHVRVMEILCAYVRENARVTSLDRTEPNQPIRAPRIDLQTAINVIKRRSVEQIAIEAKARYRLDLRNCDFRGMDLSNGNFSGAMLWRSNFEASRFDNSDLSGSQLSGSLLNYASWWDATLKGTRLDYCILDKPEPVAGGMNFNTPTSGKPYGVSVIGAEISAMDYFGEDERAFFGSKDTKLDFRQSELRDFAAKDYNARQRAERDGDTATLERLNYEVRENPFKDWSPYEANDGVTEPYRRKFVERLGLVGWPYTD